ncbi:MAG: DUF475 domain-containing protein [Myxococcota bacterium]
MPDPSLGSLLHVALVVAGLCVFEIVSSIDNAVVNAEVLGTMSPRGRRWFLVWGLLVAVFLVRGALPWAIVWVVNPSIGPLGALTATLGSDPVAAAAVERSAPVLMAGGGVFLLFLFAHWIFVEPKEFGLWPERFIARQGVWFYAATSFLLAAIVWEAIHLDIHVAFAAVLGSTAFFITHGFKQNAELAEQRLIAGGVAMTDVSKILYLEAIDASFSIDGVLGAFAFTLSIPLILVGNGLGAIVLRRLTISGIDRIRSYRLLKNGAMYSIAVLGSVMVLEAFGHHVPTWLAPTSTLGIVGYFLWRSVRREVG